MSKKPLERIKELIPKLPENDIELGYRFIEIRDFDSLKELVDSALYKVKKAKQQNPQRYIEVNIEELNMLKAEVDYYVNMLEPSEVNNNIYDNYEYESEY